MSERLEDIAVAMVANGRGLLAADELFDRFRRNRLTGELAPVSEKLAPELSLEQLIGAAPALRCGGRILRC